MRERLASRPRQFSRSKVEELLGRKKVPGYEKVDGVEYEWGT